MIDVAQYGHAIVSLAAFVLLALALSPLSAVRKAREGMVPGAAPATDYANPTYRLWRAHLNAAESMGPFAAATLAAMAAGAAPFWVNLLASLFLVSRLAHAGVHIAGVGPANFGPRTYLYVFGWLLCAVLALMAIVAAFAGPG